MQQDLLTKELSKLPAQDIILFDNKFRQRRGRAYTWKLWGAIYIIHGDCGDDSFNDFREWVIAQGKELYNRTIADPGTLINVDRTKFETDWEGMGYIPTSVFEEKTGEDMPSTFIENDEVIGEEWNEEGDDLKKLFPELYEKYA